MQLVACWKVCVYKVEKIACNVCLNVLAEGGFNQMILRCLYILAGLLWYMLYVFQLVAEVAAF